MVVQASTDRSIAPEPDLSAVRVPICLNPQKRVTMCERDPPIIARSSFAAQDSCFRKSAFHTLRQVRN